MWWSGRISITPFGSQAEENSKQAFNGEAIERWFLHRSHQMPTLIIDRIIIIGLLLLVAIKCTATGAVVRIGLPRFAVMMVLPGRAGGGGGEDEGNLFHKSFHSIMCVCLEGEIIASTPVVSLLYTLTSPLLLWYYSPITTHPSNSAWSCRESRIRIVALLLFFTAPHPPHSKTNSSWMDEKEISSVAHHLCIMQQHSSLFVVLGNAIILFGSFSSPTLISLYRMKMDFLLLPLSAGWMVWLLVNLSAWEVWKMCIQIGDGKQFRILLTCCSELVYFEYCKDQVVNWKTNTGILLDNKGISSDSSTPSQFRRNQYQEI